MDLAGDRSTRRGRLEEDRLPLNEYPRPQFMRPDWLNLNGTWEFGISPLDQIPEELEGSILVPFSPEAPLSGADRSPGMGEKAWYGRSFTLPDGFFKGRLFLNFGAVDQICQVYVNGHLAGEHAGGYTPFTVDITRFVLKAGKNRLLVSAEDRTELGTGSYGKQSSNPGGIWYTAQSGIWQTVWLESVPEEYILGLRITPLFDKEAVQILVETNAPGKCLIHLEGMVYAAAAGTPVHVPVGDMHPWSPEDPYLYPFTVTFGRDRVESYFGMRKCAVARDEQGVPRLFLNNRPLFHNGLLDQGYWPDGLYTAPAEAAMVCDIQTMKALGFNMLRKHIKIEPLRWYYLCDTMGMLVWQDMVSGGGPYKAGVVTVPVAGILPHRIDNGYKAFGRKSEGSRLRYYEELEETVKLLYNCPSIVMWVPFNEGWGQFDALEAVERIRALDSTRTIDHASGWHDQGGGDVFSRHVYFRKFRYKRDRGGRAAVLSEFGGYACGIEGHRWSKKDFGYKMFSGEKELTAGIVKLYDREIRPAKARGLSAAVYTQVSDVEEEINGLLTYDRQELKVEPDAIIAMNKRLMTEE